MAVFTRRRVLRSVPPVFPSGIANLQARYRGDLGVTIGTGVSAWADQSGNGNTLSQATGATQPTNTATLNGTKVLSFSGSQYLSLASRIAAASFTWLAVIRTTSTATTSTYAGDAPITAIGDSTGGILNGFGVGSGDAAYRVFGGVGWNQVNGTSAVNSGAAHTIAVTQNGTSGAVDVYVDNVSQTTATIVPSGTSGWDSVGRGFNVADNWVGDIAEIVTYSRVLNSTELAQLEAYFHGFWGTP